MMEGRAKAHICIFRMEHNMKLQHIYSMDRFWNISGYILERYQIKIQDLNFFSQTKKNAILLLFKLSEANFN